MPAVEIKNNLYSKITSKKYSNAREYLSSTYGEPRIRYYNADTPQEKKQKERKKIKYVSLIVATTAVCFGIAALVLGKNKNIDFQQIEDLAKETADKVKSTQLKHKIANFMSNFNNIKDDYWQKFCKKTSEYEIFGIHPLSFFDKIGSKITNLYKNTVKASFAPEWNKKVNNILEIAKKEGVEVDIENFDNWYNSLSDNVFNKLHENNNRITDNLLNKNIFKKMTKTNIADGKIRDIAINAAKEISKPSKGDSRELALAIDNFNNYKAKTASIIVPKLRDINLGSGPTDILNQCIALLSLITAVKTSDTKEEKQSVMINLGIPLLTTLTTTTVATLKALSGATALTFGLIAGECASIAANALSKKHSKKHKKEIAKT